MRAIVGRRLHAHCKLLVRTPSTRSLSHGVPLQPSLCTGDTLRQACLLPRLPSPCSPTTHPAQPSARVYPYPPLHPTGRLRLSRLLSRSTNLNDGLNHSDSSRGFVLCGIGRIVGYLSRYRRDHSDVHDGCVSRLHRTQLTLDDVRVAPSLRVRRYTQLRPAPQSTVPLAGRGRDKLHTLRQKVPDDVINRRRYVVVLH